MLDVFGDDIIAGGCEIEWCQMQEKHYWEPAGAVPTYGNEPSLSSFYQAAAIYVGVPKWGKCRKMLARISEEGKAGNEGEQVIVEEEGNEDDHSNEDDYNTVFKNIFGEL